MGLAAVALSNSQSSLGVSVFLIDDPNISAADPTFPFPGGLSPAQIDAGLASPAGVVAILGKGGAAAMVRTIP